MAKKETVKINKKHGGKEFKGTFRFIGQIKPVRRQEKDSDNWVDQPMYEEKLTTTNKLRRSLQFNLETAMSNELKMQVAGMEMDYAYPYSRKHNKAFKIAWADRNDKEKYPDDTYHLIDPEWDKAKKYSEEFNFGDWVEVRGAYEFDEYDGKPVIKRNVNTIEKIEDGQEIKNGKDEFNYVCDFNSPDFKEVNYINLQIGVKSTYQDEETKNTRVNAVFLAYGKDRSEPKDVELFVTYEQPTGDAKLALADAFATLERLDFIEIIGTDNSRAEFTYVDVEEKLETDDPFGELGDEQKVVRKERVTSGTKKGLEITGYVANTKVNGFLTEDEILKASDISNDNPFASSGNNDLPFKEEDKDPFANPFGE